MSASKQFPDPDEHVVCTIIGLNPNSAVAQLDEYPGRRGMIHVSEVANTWVRDIRKFVKVGTKIVAKVMQVEPSRDYISLSIKRVKPSAGKEKMAEYNNEKKADKLLGFAAKELGRTIEDAYKEAGDALAQMHGGLLYPAFEEARAGGVKALLDAGIPKAWAQKIAETAEKNIKEKEVLKTATLELSTFAPDGVEVIKKALEGKDTDDKAVEIQYLSAPKFRIKVRGRDYPEVESKLRRIAAGAIEIVEKSGGEGKLVED